MFRQVTAEEIEAAATASNVQWVENHKCGFCQVSVGWIIQREDEAWKVYYDPNCNCVNYRSLPHEVGWQDCADWINLQSKPEGRNVALLAFGLQPEPLPAHEGPTV